MKQRTKYILLILLIVFLSMAFELWGCALNMILEYKDVSNFVVSEHKLENDNWDRFKDVVTFCINEMEVAAPW